MTNKSIQSVGDLFGILKKHRKSVYIYRGENDTNYSLKPKLGRYNFDSVIDWPDAEYTLLSNFKLRAPPYLDRYPSSDMQWLALAQHHGLATRLLDWTENPLVALFFAVKDVHLDRDRVFYALDVSRSEYIDDAEDPFRIGKVMLNTPSHISPRIAAQRGVFSVHPSPTQIFSPKALQRFVIPRRKSIEILVDLEALGVNLETLFPGLDGISQSINEATLGA